MSVFAWASGALAAPLTLAVARGPVSLLVYVAESRGHFRDEGLDLRTVACSAGRECLNLLNDGLAQLATAADFAVVMAGRARSDLALIGTISSSSSQVKLLGRRSSGVLQPADIAGKRVATVTGTSAEYHLAMWLQAHRLEPAAVQQTGSPDPEQVAQALESGRVDAIVVWEPHASRARRALGEDAIELPTARHYTQHFNLVTTRPLVAARGDDLTRLLKALLRAQRFVAEQPEGAWRTLSSRLGMQPADARQYLADQDFHLRLDASLAATMAAQARWVRQAAGEAAVPGTGAAAAAMIEPAPLRRIDPALVTLAP